tara:strand:- start:229 stop:363 length:135 start_codon:yes stop_codon:yes gene_type:complete
MGHPQKFNWPSKTNQHYSNNEVLMVLVECDSDPLTTQKSMMGKR